MNGTDLRWLVPEILVGSLALLLLVVDLLLPQERKSVVGGLGILGLGVAGVGAALLLRDLEKLGEAGVRILWDTYTVDHFGVYFKLVAVVATALVILVGMDFFPRYTAYAGEAYGMLVFNCLGLMLMASSSELITLLLSIEFVSLTSYLLAGYLKGNPKSNEAGVKYFLYGAATTGVMAYGFSLLYGATGSTSLYDIAGKLGQLGPVGGLGVGMALAGFGFKISMVPFHQWTPDVYEGAPTPVSAYLSVGPKAAGFAALLRTLLVAVPPESMDWRLLMAVLSALSMTVGNLLALPQRNIKRMLAYSSISHAGFMLMAVAAAPSPWARPALLAYVGAYLFTNLGAFFAALVASWSTGSDEIPDYAGLSQRAPGVALAMALFMLSLTGIPPTAGFFGKYYLFSAAVDAGLLWLAVVGVLNSVVSLYYYVGVIRALYLMPPAREVSVPVPPGTGWALVLTALGTLALGVVPQPFVTLIQSAQRLLAGF
ncbi:MAG: NADH-quinone oxidoreductase subunit N [Armatimonadota bacterium]|nr:NADH-quinone oxidoreductase subunit N [Armatimonadota bacterium]MDR7443448.1 NADH-quinone oxidoreductase subunit N [Armatimonadota bacterium]MDR7569286.1 NADH-quinone oxidoreductase subunit N [Armatimonadota bacterium]MDR7614946.1 NADH-quinone oxidoreductase subunit N [Armatimonadota bacterium]